MSRRNHEREETLYRSRDGMVCGVCQGIASHFQLNVFWIRMLTVIGTILTGVWIGVVVYAVAAMLMKPEPVVPFETVDDQEFYNSYMSSRKMALHRLKRTFDNLDRRIRRMEDIVTARDYDWETRLKD